MNALIHGDRRGKSHLASREFLAKALELGVAVYDANNQRTLIPRDGYTEIHAAEPGLEPDIAIVDDTVRRRIRDLAR